jgi:hypothetical protein
MLMYVSNVSEIIITGLSIKTGSEATVQGVIARMATGQFQQRIGRFCTIDGLIVVHS